MEYIIDAKGKALGRVATLAAQHLLGKDSVDFAKNVVRNTKVKIINASLLSISEKKLLQKTYHIHTGYVGNAKSPTLSQIIAKSGYGNAIKRAVKGMLPLNTLRDKRLKNLIIEE